MAVAKNIFANLFIDCLQTNFVMQDSFLFPFCPYLHLIHDVLEQISERIALLLQVRIVRLNLHLDETYFLLLFKRPKSFNHILLMTAPEQVNQAIQFTLPSIHKLVFTKHNSIHIWGKLLNDRPKTKGVIHRRKRTPNSDWLESLFFSPLPCILYERASERSLCEVYAR